MRQTEKRWVHTICRPVWAGIEALSLASGSRALLLEVFPRTYLGLEQWMMTRACAGGFPNLRPWREINRRGLSLVSATEQFEHFIRRRRPEYVSLRELLCLRVVRPSNTFCSFAKIE